MQRVGHEVYETEFLLVNQKTDSFGAQMLSGGKGLKVLACCALWLVVKKPISYEYPWKPQYFLVFWVFFVDHGLHQEAGEAGSKLRYFPARAWCNLINYLVGLCLPRFKWR